MRTSPPNAAQTMQRVKVGMVGLAIVVLLIGLASVIFSSARQEAPIAVAGAAQPDVVANLAVENTQLPDSANEPLAELGVAPSTADTNTTAPVTPAPAARPQ